MAGYLADALFHLSNTYSPYLFARAATSHIRQTCYGEVSYRRLLAEPSFFTLIDRYPIELLFPIREGRSPQQMGKKGKEKGRWTVGIKLCWLFNDEGQVVDWDWVTLNTHGQHFHPLSVRPS